MADSPTLRERARRAARAEIAATAIGLFAKHGFEATTIDQITAAVGISRRSFFHYFGSKEDLVLGDVDALGQSVRAALEARPEEESAWEAIRAAFLVLRQAKGGAAEAEQLTLAGLHHATPSLRARCLEKRLRWQELLAPEIQRRLGLPATPDADPRAQAFVAAALACLDAATDAWYRSGGTDDPERLFDEAVTALRT